MTQGVAQTLTRSSCCHVEHLLVDLVGARVAGEERGEAGHEEVQTRNG